MQVEGVLYLKLTAENGESAKTGNQLPAARQMEMHIKSTVESQAQPPDPNLHNEIAPVNQTNQQSITGRAKETNQPLFLYLKQSRVVG